jgi:2-polyprenyl-6-methoxyphenol hydroxylase-like FAD-dependent oxidoreductase
VAVIGAGLAGLVVANHLADRGHGVIVHESRSVTGGRARTDLRDGFALNLGPHALYEGGPAVEILHELGVPLSGGNPAKKGMLAHAGRLHLAPGGPISLLRTDFLSPAEKLEVGRALARLPRLDPDSWAAVSAADWVEDMVARPRSRALVHAIIRLTTYTHAPDQLSAQVAVAQVQAGLGRPVLYLDGGWQTLVDALEGRLRDHPGVEIRYGEPLRRLPDADAVVVATGDPASTARVVGRDYRTGPPARAACLDLGLRGQPRHNFVLGVDKPFYLSNHAGPARLAPTGHSLVSCALYLGPHHATASAPESGTESARESVIEPAYESAPGWATERASRRTELESLAAMAGVEPGRVVHSRYLHNMTVVSAVATAELGGLAGRPAVDDTGRNDVFIAGDWVGHVGHLADATLASARDAAMAAHRHLARLSRPVA